MFASLVVVFLVTTIVCLCLCKGVASSSPLYTSDAAQQQYLFDSFKRSYGKTYATAEEDSRRFGIFIDNLKTADLRNAVEKTDVHGVTMMSDLSHDEFRSRYLASDISQRVSNALPAKVAGTLNTTLGAVDWSGVLTTPVKDQGYCGSCWAFSATEQIESDAMRMLGTTYILSPQQVTSCTSGGAGCNGGWTEKAYEYVMKKGGIETELNYPYTSYEGKTGACKDDSSKFVVGVKNYFSVYGETNMATYVQNTGPLSVCLDAALWNTYRSGIMSTCGKSVDHCVQAVGVDTGVGGYWKVRNSWGMLWGENGYIRLAYGQNTCNIISDPTYSMVFKV